MILGKHKKSLSGVVIALILLTAAFLRLYKIDQYMTFLGDEGRDAIIVNEIVTGKHFPLLGPPTSVGNIYLGPLYYYMMAVPFFLTGSNPVSAAVMIALIGVATVGLIYYLTREWFDEVAAVVASLLYAISPITIVLFRSSWNPHPAPFFALLTLLGFYWARVKNYRWLILSGASLAFILQMHYLALILLPISVAIWAWQLKENKSLTKNNFFLYTLISLAVFLVLMSPLFLFDLRHNFMNTKAFLAFFGNKSGSISFNILELLARLPGVYVNGLVGRYMAGGIEMLAAIICVIVITVLLRKKFHWPSFVLGVWLIVGVLGLSFYKQQLFDHYLGFLNPAPFILLGSSFTFVSRFKQKRILTYILAAVTLIIVVVNLNASPLKQGPNNQLKRTQDISKYIIAKSGGKPFNFALIAARNYDSAYQFYLDQYGHKPQQVPFVRTDQLFVVCEDEVCQPINNPKYEIAAFGWAKIEEEQNFEGVKVFKLIPNPTGH